MRFIRPQYAKGLMLAPPAIWTWWYLALQGNGATWEGLFPLFWPLNALGIILFFAGLIQWAQDGGPLPAHKPRGVPTRADGPMGPPVGAPSRLRQPRRTP